VKFILLNPHSPHRKAFDLQFGTATAENSIAAALTVLDGLLREECTGCCEIRLSEIFLPFTMVAVDPHTEHGSMVVEFYAYRKKVGERPHVLLTANDDRHWFRFYQDQFDAAWADSTAWPGGSANDARKEKS